MLLVLFVIAALIFG